MKPVDEAEAKEMPAHPYWLYQYIRGIDGEILVKRLNTLTTPIRELHELWKGPGTVSFEPSVAAPFHIIEPEEYVDSFYMVADIAMPTGEVVHDFLE